MTKIFKRSLSLIMTLVLIVSTFAFCLPVFAIEKVSVLKASAATENSISLAWTKVTGAEGYCLLKYDFSSKKWKTLKVTTATTYTDVNLAPGTLNAYAVTAMDAVDNKYVYSAPSDIIRVLTLPGATTNLRVAKLSYNSVSLQWDKAAGAQSYAVFQYNTATKKYQILGTTAATSCTVNSLTALSTYYFVVRAFVKNGYVAYGANSNVLTVKTPEQDTLDKVNNLRLDAFNAKAYRIRWDAVKDAFAYQVVVYDAATRKWKLVAATVNTYVVFNAQNPSGTYRYMVRAYKKAANGYVFGSYSDPVDAFAKPGTPTGLTSAENSNHGISLAWTKVPGVDGYEVYTYDAVNGKWIYKGTSISNSYNVGGLDHTSHYKYIVRACKLSGGKRYYGDFCESITVSYRGTESDSIYSEEMEKSGVLGYLYDPSGKYFYTADDPWQRNVGYNAAFDVIAPITLINFDTARLNFEYGNKDWLIQVWKGQYGLIFYGAELGVYTKSKDRGVKHYDCASDSEMLKMSFTFNEFINGRWQQRFTRPYGYYWWCTGFLPGNKKGNFDTILLNVRITAKDYNMLASIKNALAANGIYYSSAGLDVYFNF